MHHDLPPAAVFMHLATGKWVTKALAVAAEFGLADHVGADPVSVESVADAVNLPCDGTYRLMRALSAVGVFAETSTGTFVETSISQLLRRDHPQTMRGLAIMMGHDFTWEPWRYLADSVKTGESGFPRAFGKPIFAAVSDQPELAKVFDDAMTGISNGWGEAIASALDVSGLTTLVDVGGGHGSLLATILGRHPTLRGTVLDLPHVAPGAAVTFVSAGVAERAEVVIGSFFEQIPSGDAVIMKTILHDWNDTDAIRILETCHRALPVGGKLFVCEAVLGPEPSFGKLLDLEMLIMTHGGRERTAAEFGNILGRAGFEFAGVQATRCPLAIVTGIKR
jgi:hypothetical protein